MSIESRRHQYGTIFEHWQIGEPLGVSESGKTAVFKLQHKESSQEESAVKVITLIEEHGKLSEFSDRRKAEYEAELEKRKKHALKEVQIMYALKGYTNIVGYEDRATEHWTETNSFGCDLLIRMELLCDLRKIIRTGHIFSESEVLQIGKDICSALILCHGEKEPIIHRDIKPENIFVNSRGTYKLGDFGISRILDKCHGATATTATGTPAYLAPEQIQREYDERVDIYSLGLVLYELSNQNRLPFAESAYDSEKSIILRMAGNKLPDPCDASPALAEVIRKACAFKADSRYQTAKEMLDALEQISINNPAWYPDWEKSVDRSSNRGFETEPANTADRKSDFETIFATGSSNGRNPYDTLPAAPSHGVIHKVDEAEDASNPGGMGGSNYFGFDYRKLVSRLTSRPMLLLIVPVVALLFFILWPKHSHTWEAATCAQPKTCSECGETKGTPLEHILTEASCVEPAICTECGTVVQEALGHKWEESAAGLKTCIVCQETEGSSSLEQIASEAKAYAEAGLYRKAIQILDEAWRETGDQALYDLAGDYRMEFGISNTSYIAAGKYNSVLIKDDGSVVVVGDDEFGELDAKYWSDIVAVSAGDRHIVGLRSNGTVVSVGANDVGQREFNSWRDVVAIAAGDVHTIALQKDGTLLAAGQLWAPRCDVDKLHRLAGERRIVSIAAGYLHTLALLEDGTVISSGENGQQQCDVENWTDIAAIYAGTDFSVGLKTDGTVVMSGLADWSVSGWTDMVNLAAGDFFVVGITSDGSLLSAGMESSIGPNTPRTVSIWTDIVQVAAGTDHIIALTGEGKTHCAGKNDEKQINLDAFTVTYPRNNQG